MQAHSLHFVSLELLNLLLSDYISLADIRDNALPLFERVIRTLSMIVR